jgi:hypothetical protein
MGIDQDPAPGLSGDEPGLPTRDPGLPRRDPGLPRRDPGLPKRDPGLPKRDSGLPAGESPSPGNGSARPPRESPLPTRGSGLPARETPLPTRGSGLPSRNSALPMRTTRTRPPGRHRSPDRLSVPPDAPALVLAVPGAVTESSIEVAAGVIEVATQSCPGVTVRAGFTEGPEESLRAVLADCQVPDGLPAAVVVPLLICPQPDVTAAIAATIAAAPVPALQAEPLGVHPLLAGALHARLAESGLARGDRIGRISIVTTAAEGLLVAAVGEDAEAAAGTVAVLLAARLAVPVAAASFGSASSIRNAAGRLMDAGVAGLALAPCVIGPEIGHLDLTAVANAAGMKTAQPLGAQTAIGQLAAVRYGAALQDPQLAGASG